MSDNERYESTTDEDNGSGSDSGFSPGRKNGKGDPVQCDSERGDDVQLDKTTDSEKMGTNVPRTGVKRGRASAKKSPKRKRQRCVRSRTFVGTLNNPTAEDIEYYRSVPLEELSWIIVGDEKGKEKETPHLQMACRFNDPITMTKAMKVFGRNKAHVEIMKGTSGDSVKYCSKEKLLIERGIRPSEPGRAKEDKMAAMVKMIKDGTAEKSIFEAFPAMYLRYRSSISAAKSLFGGNIKRRPVEIYWYWGETGAGKSYRAESEAAEDGRRLYRQNGSNWWDGYDGDELVIIDDLEETAKFRDLLKITDVYNFLVGTKGSHQWLKAEKIWITASFPPAKIDQGGQLERRMKKIVNMSKDERPDIIAQLKKQFKNDGPTDIMD